MLVIYHPCYRIGSAALNSLHPFEFDRADQVAALLSSELGPAWPRVCRAPERPLSMEQLRPIHDADYLRRAHHSGVIASIIEVPVLRWCPRFLMRRWFLEPALWCLAGTVLAARSVLEQGLVFQVGGGFHHAKRRWGEGFCMFSDIALAITTLRTEGLLEPGDPIAYIDLDVHQGNGVSCDYAEDPAVRILDVFNEQIYPFRDAPARAGIDVARPLPSGTRDGDYLAAVESGLEELFEGWVRPRLVIYNAGTDIFEKDLLGDFKVTREGVQKRDRLVWEAVRGRGIPMLVLASGGYSRMSPRLIADFVVQAYQGEESEAPPQG